MALKNLTSVVFWHLLLIGIASSAAAQSLKLEVQAEELNAGVPFVLAVKATGFDSGDEPKISTLSIPGCDILPLGVSSSISTSVQIINGNVAKSRTVIYSFRFRITPGKPGDYHVPMLIVTQGTTEISTKPARFAVRPVASTRDMRLEMTLPQRTLWVGETVPAILDWYLRRDVDEQNFVVPLFDTDAVEIAPANDGGDEQLPFVIGGREVGVEFERESAYLGGQSYTRFRFRFLVTARRAGRIELDAPSVTARMNVGNGRDAFGFRKARRRRFSARGASKSLEIRGLPLSGRPPSFGGAVGSGFSLQVAADRTVVAVGDPIALTMTVRGHGELHGLSLPPLGGAFGLPKEHFAVADDWPVGELLEDGGAKRFVVSVRLKSPAARAIPALPFSYFDPARGKYHTVHSEPIALSVAGANIIGAGDVVSSAPSAASRNVNTAIAPALGQQRKGDQLSLVGADLALSHPSTTLQPSGGIAANWWLIPLLYLLPCFGLCLQLWRRRTTVARGQRAALKQARANLRAEASRATSRAARDSAPALARSLRELARLVTLDDVDELIAKIEVAAYDPAAANSPLNAEFVKKANSLVDTDATTVSQALLSTTLFIAVGISLVAAASNAATPAAAAAQCRADYNAALQANDREPRRRLFSRSAACYATLCTNNPGLPELLTDWGNAALGAEDLGTAILAFKRALAIEPQLERAALNISWVRKRLPAAASGGRHGALDALLFWTSSTTSSQRQLIAALAFALGVLMLTPWGALPTGLHFAMRRGAYLVFGFWLVSILAIAVHPDTGSDAVVMYDDVVLRSADSLGATAALLAPLAAGTEVSLLERRDSWSRISLPGGTTGWLRSAAVSPVVLDH